MENDLGESILVEKKDEVMSESYWSNNKTFVSPSRVRL